jgi:hypothetical protein
VPFSGLPRSARSAGASMPWSMALRTRCISGSPSFSTTDLSSSVSAPVMTRSMALAHLARAVAHDAVEAVEGVADLHHAQLQRRVADVLDEAQQHRGRFDQVGLAAALGEQVGAGAGDDHLADEVDQLVELVGVHAHHARFDAPSSR